MLLGERFPCRCSLEIRPRAQDVAKPVEPVMQEAGGAARPPGDH